jgi:hypothetical protein
VGLHSLSGCSGQEKYLFPLLGFEPLTIYPAAQSAYRLCAKSAIDTTPGHPFRGLMQLHTSGIDSHKPFPTTPAGLVQGILEFSPTIYESE